jgi:hypothetical protein
MNIIILFPLITKNRGRTFLHPVGVNILSSVGRREFLFYPVILLHIHPNQLKIHLSH